MLLLEEAFLPGSRNRRNDAVGPHSAHAMISGIGDERPSVLGQTSRSRAIPCRAIVEGNDKAPRPTILTIPIVRVPKKATQPTRGPSTVAQPSISPREIRHAA